MGKNTGALNLYSGSAMCVLTGNCVTSQLEFITIEVKFDVMH